MKMRRLIFGLLLSGLLMLPVIVLGGEESSRVAQNISAAEACSLIQEYHGKEGFVILDIRTPGEYDEGHIEGSENINYYSNDFTGRLKALDRERTYLIYCRSGGRSGRTLELMKELGFLRVYNLIGGVTGWQKEGFSVTRPLVESAKIPIPYYAR
jgi:rhodanese-related sulfurtransferase